MNASGIKAVPVVEGGRLVGMVTLEHLSEVFMLLSSSRQDDSAGPALIASQS